jgi:TPR repeat protein
LEKNLVEAVRFYKLAADQGLALAQCCLGVCYEYGKGVSKQFASIDWRPTKGVGVSKDPSEAVRYYRLAADQGLALAQFCLGFCYNNGEGVSKDPSEAVRFYRLAADQGLALAQCNLGVYYENGEGVSKDPSEAVRYYRLAQYNLGLCYKKGEGVSKDIEEYKRLVRLAAAQGNSSAVAETKNFCFITILSFFLLLIGY